MAKMSDSIVERAFQQAAAYYAELGVDVHAALDQLSSLSVSLHCWQGDDVGGFEQTEVDLGGGLAVTGSYPGRARNPDQLRADLDMACSLIPGKHRLNLHASYAETNRESVPRNELEPRHFAGWMEWADERKMGLDFNPTFFAHPLAADGVTLSHPDPSIRQFWIEHGIVCRRIAQAMGEATRSPCVCNVWIPDGSKDLPADRRTPRERLVRALDEVFRESWPADQMLDAVECKLFGLGSESYVVGSHEFYLGYAASREKVLCLDSGHFHPTESIGDKISAVMLWVPRLLLHVSRGVRWDSDHVVLMTDQVREITQELVRGDYLDRVHLGLDFFDASINRVAAWVIGTRAFLKCLLWALLEPVERLQALEAEGNWTARLALMDDLTSGPAGSVWDYYCLRQSVPLHTKWLSTLRRYEHDVMLPRDSSSVGDTERQNNV